MLKIRNLQKYDKFNSKCSINLEIASRGIVVLLGDKGSGNKTLLNIIGGIDTFDSGDFLVENISINDLSEKELASYRNTYTGFISDNVNLFNELSVSQNIALALELQGYDKGKISKLVDETLTRFNLQKSKDNKPNDLSELEKQKVKIARAIIKNPKIILVDGIINKLKKEDVKIILDILKELSKEKIVIMATSKKEIVEQYSDRIIEFKDGQIISDNIISENNLRINKDNDNVILKTSSLPFKNMLNLAMKNIFKKKITSLSLILTILFFSLATTFAQYDAAKVTGKTINKKEINTIWIYKPYSDKTFEEYRHKLIEIDERSTDVLSDISLLKQEYSNNQYYEVRINQLYNIKYEITIYSYPSDPYYNYVARKNVVIYDSVEHLKSSIIYGDKLKEYNDVYITDFLANWMIESKDGQIQMDSLIGTKIFIHNDSMYNMIDEQPDYYNDKVAEYNIAGILKTDYEKYNNLKECRDVKTILESGYPIDAKTKYNKIITTRENIDYFDNILLESAFISLYNPKINENEIGYFYNSDYWSMSHIIVSATFNSENYVLLGDSKMPTNENEIVIPFNLLGGIIDSEGLGFPTEEELKSNQDNYLNEYLNKKIFLSYNKLLNGYNDNLEEKEMTIVGMYLSKDESNPYYEPFIVSDDLYKELYLDNISRNYEVELGGSEQENLAFFESLEDLKYKHITPYSNIIYDLESISNSSINLFYIFGGIMFVIYILNKLMSNSSETRYIKEEIHTLRVLGVSRIDIVKFFIIEGLRVVILAMFIGFIISIATVGMGIETNQSEEFHSAVQLYLKIILICIFIIFLIWSTYSLKDYFNKLLHSQSNNTDFNKLSIIKILLTGLLSIYIIYKLLFWNDIFLFHKFTLSESSFNQLVLLLVLATITYVAYKVDKREKEINKGEKENYKEQRLVVSKNDMSKILITQSLRGLTSILITFIVLSMTVLLINLYVINKNDIAYFLPYQNVTSLIAIIGLSFVISLISGLVDILLIKRDKLLK